MHQPTIEFSPVPDDTGQPLRQFFRVPVHKTSPVSVLISDTAYPVSDISQTGIGIFLEDNQKFQIGERLYPCRLHCDDTRLTDLAGTVIHCSLHDNFWQFGIQWTDLNDSQKQQMAHLVARLKTRELASPQSSVPEEPGNEK